MPADMERDAFVEALDKCNWWADYPDTASADRSRAAFPRPNEFDPATAPGAVLLWFADCVGEGQYGRFLGEMREASQGLFDPQKIEEVWPDDYGTIRLSFEHAGQSVDCELQASEFVDLSFLGSVNEALQATAPGLAFIVMQAELELVVAIAFTSPAAYRLAHTRGLVPTPHIVGVDELLAGPDVQTIADKRLRSLTQKYLDGLEACHAYEGLPPELADSYRRRIVEQVIATGDPRLGLVTATYPEGDAGDPAAFDGMATSIVEQLREASFGYFRYSEMRERWDGNQVELKISGPAGEATQSFGFSDSTYVNGLISMVNQYLGFPKTAWGWVGLSCISQPDGWHFSLLNQSVQENYPEYLAGDYETMAWTESCGGELD